MSLGALGLLILTSWKVKNPEANATLSNLANTILAIGVVGLIYELLLRDTVFRETVETIGLRDDVAASSLSGIRAANALDWDNLLDETDEIKVLVMNPVGWIERDWGKILESAGRRPLAVTLFLQQSDAASVAVTASKLGYERAALAESLLKSRDYLESSWKNAKASQTGPVKGSKFDLRVADFVPGYEVVVTQTKVGILVPSALSQVPGSKQLHLTFTKRRGDFPASWVVGQFEELRNVPPEFVDEVK